MQWYRTYIGYDEHLNEVAHGRAPIDDMHLEDMNAIEAVDREVEYAMRKHDPSVVSIRYVGKQLIQDN